MPCASSSHSIAAISLAPVSKNRVVSHLPSRFALCERMAHSGSRRAWRSQNCRTDSRVSFI